MGTSGQSYLDWAEAGFYPPRTKPGRMLALYAQRFPVGELNSTWYQIPKAEALERQRGQTPPDFLFSVKLTRSLTHEPPGNRLAELVSAFRHGIAPLLQSNQLAAVLVQFPLDFQRTVANRRYLAGLLDELEGLPLAVEFRHASWAAERVFAGLEGRGVSLAAVDGPGLPGLFPSLEVVTNPNLLYVRLHGRNPKGWNGDGRQSQFDYDYREEELRVWLEERLLPMAGRAGQGLVFFGNHVRAQAVRNALTLTGLLEEYGLGLGRA